MPKQYEVGGTLYEFPDEFTDDQVTGILAKQGIINPGAPKQPQAIPNFDEWAVKSEVPNFDNWVVANEQRRQAAVPPVPSGPGRVPSVGPAVDYDALAKQFGGADVDYDALAKSFGGVDIPAPKQPQPQMAPTGAPPMPAPPLPAELQTPPKPTALDQPPQQFKPPAQPAQNIGPLPQVKYLLWTVAIGGPAALGIASLMHTVMPDSPYTQQLDAWQETASLAGFLQMPRLAKAVGIWQFPGADEVLSPYRKWWEKMAEYVAGPTINGIVDTLHTAGVEGLNLNDEEANERAWKLTMELMRDWMPAGTALRRLGQAMQQGDNTEEQLAFFSPHTAKTTPIPA